jgi:hypothetical protein
MRLEKALTDKTLEYYIKHRPIVPQPLYRAAGDIESLRKLKKVGSFGFTCQGLKMLSYSQAALRVHCYTRTTGASRDTKTP